MLPGAGRDGRTLCRALLASRYLLLGTHRGGVELRAPERVRRQRDNFGEGSEQQDRDNQSSSKTKAIKFLTTSSSMESAVPTHHSWSTIIAGTAHPEPPIQKQVIRHVYMQLRTISNVTLRTLKSLFHYWEIGKVHIKAILNISSDCLKRNRNTSLPASCV